MSNTKVLRLVFCNADTALKTTQFFTMLGTFTNRVLHGEQNYNQLARTLTANCLPEERALLVGYCIDDGSIDTINVPSEAIKPIMGS